MYLGVIGVIFLGKGIRRGVFRGGTWVRISRFLRRYRYECYRTLGELIFV